MKTEIKLTDHKNLFLIFMLHKILDILISEKYNNNNNNNRTIQIQIFLLFNTQTQQINI